MFSSRASKPIAHPSSSDHRRGEKGRRDPATTYEPQRDYYDDSTITLTSASTPDPFVNRFRGWYYMTYTAGNRIEIWRSRSLVDIEKSGSRHVIWTPPPHTEHSAHLWAPELHALWGRWYVYYAAAHPTHGNKSHRIYVLGGPPATEDPCGERGARWEFLGRIRNMPHEQWGIDATVFELGGPDDDGNDSRREEGGQGQYHDEKEKETEKELYCVYSGWPLSSRDESDLEQRLYIVRLSDPVTAAPSDPNDEVLATKPVEISRPEHPWEITVDHAGVGHGINEGPQWLCSPRASSSTSSFSFSAEKSEARKWSGLVYSCAGSWTRDYKMATLEFLGGDPLDPRAWRKGREPLITSRDMYITPIFPRATGKRQGEEKKKKKNRRGSRLVYYGPGHGSFLHVGNRKGKSADGNTDGTGEVEGEGEVVAVFHATDRPTDGWENRRARVQRVGFTEEGPYMSRSFGMLPARGAEEESPNSDPVTNSSRDGGCGLLSGIRAMTMTRGELRGHGVEKAAAVNKDLREAGEKSLRTLLGGVTQGKR